MRATSSSVQRLRPDLAADCGASAGTAPLAVVFREWSGAGRPRLGVVSVNVHRVEVLTFGLGHLAPVTQLNFEFLPGDLFSDEL
jgi:hypothetical protein